MSVDFDWRIEEEDGPTSFPEPRPRRRFPWGLILLLGVALMAVGGGSVAYRVRQSEAVLGEEVQTLVDFEREAFLAGDGELFFSTQSAESDWLTTQLRPETQQQQRAGLTITHAEQHGDSIWANAEWTDDNGTWQRILFFQHVNGNLTQIDNSAQFWGVEQTKLADWGLLKLSEADESWTDEMRDFVADTLTEACGGSCADNLYPLVVTIRNDFSVTASPNQLYVPSPRLLGLDTDGNPSPQFWQRLRNEINALAAPITLRYAIQPQAEQHIDYAAAASQFHKLHPNITIEFVQVDQMPDDSDALRALDGAAFVPTEAMLAAGLVHDLSDYVRTDFTFDQADFYDAIWSGSRWRERVWFMPHAATLRPIYYDLRAYAESKRLPPSLRWTWDELAADMDALVAAQSADSWIKLAYLDTSLDTLYAYAFTHEPACQVRNQAPCQAPLSAEAITTTLDWYLANTADWSRMAELSRFPLEQRDSVMTNWQSARRQSAIWVDDAVNYEHRLLLLPLGVTTFPGTDRFDGTTPLWLHGGFVSAYSEHPRAMWMWLAFLSNTTPLQHNRQIPARASVAHANAFWETLPRDLGDPMRTAFAMSRAVRIDEQTVFTWEKLAQVVTDGVVSAEKQPALRWFTNQ